MRDGARHAARETRGAVMLLFIMAVCWLAGRAARGGERLTPERLWDLARLGSACLSPAGDLVIYAVRRYDLTENRGRSELRVVTLPAQQDRVLLDNLRSADDLQLAITPQGPRVLFVGVPGGDEFQDAQPQVWSVDLQGGAPLQVTSVEAGVTHLKVSPTGTHLALTAEVKLDPTVTELYPDLPKADARIIDGLMYRHWDAWHDYAFSHLHVAPLQEDGRAGAAIDLMAGLRADCPLPPFGGAEQFNWSPDGRELAFTTKVVNNPAESTDSGIFVVAADGQGRPECITAGMPGADTEPVYAPNGQYLAFHSMERAGFEADKNRLLVFDRARRTLRDLTAQLDQTTQQVTWMPDAQSLVFKSEHRGCDQLFRVTLDTAEVTQISRGAFDWSLRGVLPDGATLLVDSQTMLRPVELALLSVSDATARPLTQLNDARLGQLDQPRVTERWVPATDGKQIHCWVIYPPDFDPQRKWPLITYCQGGPQGQVGQWFSYRWNFHLMAAHGYVVVAPNRRGLPGFGRAWNDQISGDWGGQAMQDLLSATDAMMVEPYIDARRMAAVGASYGGYSVYWLMGNHQDRFCCMISHAGVFNLESMFGATEELWFPTWDLGGPYWLSPSVAKSYERFSPHRYVRQWRTPLLVVHGEKDYRVPVTQGMEAFTAAQLNGVPSRFLYFPTESHWVQGPQNGVLWHRVFFEWLDRYCKP
jgi:dipeptidyl aminopeptidase/acylaminoacyl peptidase